MKTFRKLRPDEIQVRVNNVTAKGATFLLYKDARCDMDILDETVGPGNWQRGHAEHKGNLFCTVGINVNHDKEDASPLWVWKEDCGTESNTEKEKGEASDSFKRACVNWGIGRELYTKINIFIRIATEESGKKPNGKPIYKLSNPYFKAIVRDIKYTKAGKISYINICEEGNEDVSLFEWKNTQAARPAGKETHYCKLCEHEITPYTGTNGKTISPAKHLARSREIYGDDYCITCISSGLLDGERNAG